MNKREQAQLLTSKELTFLGGMWDAGLMGVAENNFLQPIPVYSYRACKFLASEKYNSSDTFAALLDLFDNEVSPSPGILLQPAKEEFWKYVASHNLPVWEHINKAVSGVLKGVGPSPRVAYDRAESIRQLEFSSIASDGADSAMDVLQNQILPTNLGDATPVFVRWIPVSK